MTTADDVRRVGLALPRAYEAEVRGRSKLRVGSLVFVAFSRDEAEMGFGFPKLDYTSLNPPPARSKLTAQASKQ